MTTKLIEPDQNTKANDITVPPGVAEAMRIREFYKTALAGMRAYVEMGFCLIDVKARLPHGKYLPWCEKNLGGLGRRHLHRSKFIAEGLLEMAESNGTHCVSFENLPTEILDIIDGASGIRSLLGQINEFRADETESENRKLCEVRWKKDAELRDEWEPRVLAGEITYTLALRGMIGQEESGKSRRAVDYAAILGRNITSLPNCWKHWSDLSEKSRNQVLAELPKILDDAPAVVISTLVKSLERKLPTSKKLEFLSR